MLFLQMLFLSNERSREWKSLCSKNTLANFEDTKLHNWCSSRITCFAKTDCCGVTHLRAVPLGAGGTGNPEGCPGCSVGSGTPVRGHFPKPEEPFTFPLPFQPHSLLSGLCCLHWLTEIKLPLGPSAVNVWELRGLAGIRPLARCLVHAVMHRCAVKVSKRALVVWLCKHNTEKTLRLPGSTVKNWNPL